MEKNERVLATTLTIRMGPASTRANPFFSGLEPALSGSVTERSYYRRPNQSSVLWLDELVSQIGARSGWKREPIGTEYKSSVS